MRSHLSLRSWYFDTLHIRVLADAPVKEEEEGESTSTWFYYLLQLKLE